MTGTVSPAVHPTATPSASSGRPYTRRILRVLALNDAVASGGNTICYDGHVEREVNPLPDRYLENFLAPEMSAFVRWMPGHISNQGPHRRRL